MTNNRKPPHIHFDNSFQRELEAFCTPWQGDVAPQSTMLKFNTPLAKDLGLDADDLNSDVGAALFSGSLSAEGTTPVAMLYAGHQFGHFTPQLGDGRALLLGELFDQEGQRRDIHLKGSGRTPYSRGGDGKAALGPVLREYIIGEAMHALNIPTTRALAVVTTGENVEREKPLPGAVLARVAASHIRIGTFQYFAARGDMGQVRQLADYTIKRHHPDLLEADNPYHALLDRVIAAQASLIANWVLVGFVHGVMNTDNMTISGETIDYGPCAFIDHYDPEACFSSIDAHGRYAYKNQPAIGQWNLTRLAECLLPFLDDDDDRAVEKATRSVNAFTGIYVDQWLKGMQRKLGLATSKDGDLELANELLMMMEGQNVDYTLLFRALSKAAIGDDAPVLAIVSNHAAMDAWLKKWHARCATEDISAQDRMTAMNGANPLYIPRNHLVEDALKAAVDDGDMSQFEALMDVLGDPFAERDGLDHYAQPAPAAFGPYRTFCGT